LKWISFNKFEKALDDQVSNIHKFRRPGVQHYLGGMPMLMNDAYFIADYSFFDSQPITLKSSPNRSAEPVYESVAARKNLPGCLKDIAQRYEYGQKNGSWYFLRSAFWPDTSELYGTSFCFAYRLELQDHKLTATETEKYMTARYSNNYGAFRGNNDIRLKIFFNPIRFLI
jgi:inner membrane protein